ncbi:GTPase-activating protein GYP5 [Cyberlindnera fabianii]|uniref:GTPase-activating protein GYP5 n=1 Tax=Cyberlindnera fabianii TaxID=36022 RepID=A0A1V2L6R5_CYBFA|nr:GTPase-activating protein GYP5 [Cyberlindnera fabianii]
MAESNTDDDFKDAVEHNAGTGTAPPLQVEDSASSTVPGSPKKKKNKKKKKKSKNASTDSLSEIPPSALDQTDKEEPIAEAPEDAALSEPVIPEAKPTDPAQPTEATDSHLQDTIHELQTHENTESTSSPKMITEEKFADTETTHSATAETLVEGQKKAEETEKHDIEPSPTIDNPLGESTQQFEVSEDDLKNSNKSLEEKLDMLKLYTDGDEGDEFADASSDKLADGGADKEEPKADAPVSTSDLNQVSPDPIADENLPTSPLATKAPPPTLPSRDHTAKPAEPAEPDKPALPPRSPQSNKAPALPSRDHVATTPVPPQLPSRDHVATTRVSSPPVTQGELALTAAELPPPPLPPQLTEKQKAHHRGSFLSWFGSTSRGSTTSLSSDANKLDYDENYDLLLSRLTENTEELSAKDDTTRQQINSTHDTLKSSFHRVQADQTGNDTTTAGSSTADATPEATAIDWSFWAEVVNDYPSVVKSDPSKLSKMLSAGIPDQIRGIVWQLVSNVNAKEFEEAYPGLHSQDCVFDKNIQKDINRTSFAGGASGVDKEALYRVIKAYSNLDTEVGYTQGMAFIAVPLLMNMDELEAFSLLHKLMKGYGLRELFLPEMPGLLLKMYQFDRILEDNLPALSAHFQRQGIRSSMYASQWFLTFFAYKFPLEIVLRIFDLVITEGIESILKFAVALVQKNADVLITLKFDELLGFLKEQLFYAYSSIPVAQDNEDQDGEARVSHASRSILADSFEVDQLVEDATNVKILPITLKRYTDEWDEIHREEKERREEIEELRLRNNQMKKEIRKVEAQYTILNREHVQIANEMIAGRMKIAELEDANKDLKDQNSILRERVKSLQNPISEDVPVPAALEEDLKNTMARNLEVMNKNQELEEYQQELLQEIESLKSQLEAEKAKNASPSPPLPIKNPAAGLWGKKLFK